MVATIMFHFRVPATTSVSAAVLPGSYSLKLMTFNVRKMTADDGTSNSWSNRKNIAVHAIDSFGPDVMGLQEADKAQIDYFIANSSGTYQSIGTSREGSTTTGEFSNIMYKSDKFNLLNWGEFWLSETPDVPGSKSSLDTEYPRMSTWVKLQAKDNANAVFYYFNTHFSLELEAAEQAANIMLSKVAEYVKASDAPVFIGGDLNRTEVSPVYAILQNSAFDDLWRTAGKSFANDGTYYAFTGDIDRAHIDWIFGKNVTSVNSIEINRYNEGGFYPSDHYPVNASVTIPLTTDTAARPIGQTIWLKAANGNYVSARANTADSPLWAYASSANTWEKYEVADAGNGFVSLIAKANNLYVSARITTTDIPLHAKSASIGSWEKFIWIGNGDGTVSFRAIANNKHVSARTNETDAPLETRIDSISSWERFTWGN
ncbi:endonuclease/exonuclease/phosphatase family protein [Paenibacillus sp. GD4]|uniref:endonuclease/exonuclease/phosphatase family protein n=1 Tax=Paenibacillus sp. GD4 TaxID=3068890 RepID=UPI002796BFF1|nr:endonuclease/exonuclease/phosphatase family protein [Paenibacillus sp. GD4]MDQ1914056.1 endonuclease/exonuclease/phosphatase family protein [Paenibacillus sp. GD4]